MLIRSGDGPIPAKIMLVGEAWGVEEERKGVPFVGASGQELNRMLHEAQIMRSEIFVSNLVNARPPNNDLGAWIAEKKKDITPAHVFLREKWVLPIITEGYQHLLREIALVKPNIIVTCGSAPTWALTGKSGIMRWRSSMLTHESGCKLIPVLHPAAILRQWSWRAVTVSDLRRVKRESESRDYSIPERKFIIRPTYATVIAILDALIADLNAPFTSWDCWVDFDLETKNGHIDCAGISWSRADALCIPFMCRSKREGYWSLDEEAYIIYKLYRLLTHPKVKVRGQNLLYDCQYTHRYWHFVPNVKQDCMISQHSVFCAQRKSLDFQASLYAGYYVQWKKEKGAWKED